MTRFSLNRARRQFAMVVATAAAAASAAALGVSALAVPPDVLDHSGASSVTTSVSSVTAESAASAVAPDGEAAAAVSAVPALAARDDDDTRAKLVAAAARYRRVLHGAAGRVTSIKDAADANARELRRQVAELVALLPGEEPVEVVKPGEAADDAAPHEPAEDGNGADGGADMDPPSASTAPASATRPAARSPATSPAVRRTGGVWIRLPRVQALCDGLLREAVVWQELADAHEGDRIVRVPAAELMRLQRLESALESAPIHTKEATR